MAAKLPMKFTIVFLRTLNCKRLGHHDVNVNNARVCIVCFVPGDYERDLRNELLDLPIRTKIANKYDSLATASEMACRTDSSNGKHIESAGNFGS
ncbi:hypothetical protein PR048_010726 [Dryococelus australis]|uniref:Uncharacterized protein n=1 Tax=Dryococelus australis TaxID=614101 RepID=A0ABQ9I3K0_9NEOP|nr:hypothetical protein PR048_010726 [Dryococelus australis]